MTTHSTKDHYKNAGVDTEKGDAVVEWLQSKQKGFMHPRNLGSVRDGIGGFAGLFKINFASMQDPQLVASTDGVGTKLLLGIETAKISGLGQDLVAMCVNDLYTVGAIPLFFLDYYATGALDAEQFKSVLSSIQSSCKTCGMALLGGETAEMPGLYESKHFDLAGFVVGVVDEPKRLGPHKVKRKDRLIAFKSSGFHSNGYSLIRKWLKDRPNSNISEQLMAPTKLYSEIPELAEKFPQGFHALANITGGGISGNLPRVLPTGLKAHINMDKLPTPAWMREFIQNNQVKLSEVEPVFNLGCGMIAVVSETEAASFAEIAGKLGLEPSDIGFVDESSSSADVIYI
jgi:phosphoribosylformylglycinamidine cyclo-ligase